MGLVSWCRCCCCIKCFITEVNISFKLELRLITLLFISTIANDLFVTFLQVAYIVTPYRSIIRFITICKRSNRTCMPFSVRFPVRVNKVCWVDDLVNSAFKVRIIIGGCLWSWWQNRSIFLILIDSFRSSATFDSIYDHILYFNFHQKWIYLFLSLLFEPLNLSGILSIF